jgi:hypothetical protein
MRWICAVAVLLASGCALPPHFPISVAAGPRHVTYAYRTDDKEKNNDYLVDCKLDETGQQSQCVTVQLEGKE